MGKLREYPGAGGAIFNAPLIQNYGTAVERYRQAALEAKRNMAELLKANADKQTDTPYPTIPQDKYYGNKGRTQMPGTKSEEEIQKSNELAGKAQQDYGIKRDAELKQAQPSFVGPATPYTTNKPTLAERMQLTEPTGSTNFSVANILQESLKTPQRQPAKLANAITAYDTGIGGGDASTVNPEISNYMSDQLRSYAGTKKGLADFMTKLAEVEANEGTTMDTVANLADQDPSKVREDIMQGVPKLADIMKMPDEISKRATDLRTEATALAGDFNVKRAMEHLGNLIAENPTAHAALQNGILTVAPDGSLQYDYGKAANLGLDERNKIAQFLGDMGSWGYEVYTKGMGAKTNYGTINSPELDRSLKPREQYDSNKAVKRGTNVLTFNDSSGNVVNAAEMIIPDVNDPNTVRISPDDPNKNLYLYEWTNGNDRIYTDPNSGEYVYEYKDSSGKTKKDKIPENEIYNKIKEKNLESKVYTNESGNQAMVDMSKFGSKSKTFYQSIYSFNHAARNNDPNYFAKYSIDKEPQGKVSTQKEDKIRYQKTWTEGDITIKQEYGETAEQARARAKAEAKEKKNQLLNSWLKRQAK
ncbi:MAG: hypothetical protein WC549_02105 [Actinomycetota bacterium]